MAVEFSEYRGKRKKPFHRHRFPLLVFLVFKKSPYKIDKEERLFDKSETIPKRVKEASEKYKKQAESVEITSTEDDEKRREEILKEAEKRHKKRTVTEEEKIQAKWTLSHPHSQMPQKFNDANDIATFWNKIDNARETLGKEKIFKNGEFKYGGVDKINNASTEFWNGTIFLDDKIKDLCVSAFEKIKIHKIPSEKETKALCTLWHEMTHNRHKLHPIKAFDITNDKTDYYMEMANEFVARKTLPEFFVLIGAKKAPYKQFMRSRKNCGYNDSVIHLESTLDFFKIDKESFLKQAQTDLFNEGYNLQKDRLVSNIFSRIPGITRKDAENIVKECVEFDETRYLSFKEMVLQPIKDKIGGKK